MTETIHQDVDDTLTTQPAPSEPLASEFQKENEMDGTADKEVDAADQHEDTNV